MNRVLSSTLVLLFLALSCTSFSRATDVVRGQLARDLNREWVFGFRLRTMECWRSLSPLQLKRSGIHQQTGTELSLERIRTIHAGHDLSHLSQIEERLQLLSAG